MFVSAIYFSELRTKKLSKKKFKKLIKTKQQSKDKFYLFKTGIETEKKKLGEVQIADTRD